ncbi:MAG TPA: hypothetical protein VF331_00385 [Polyangiales bacterium]
MYPSRLFVVSLLALAGHATCARAMDKFEIQVYQGEHNEPGQVSCELHSNYTFSGQRAPGYSGETPADRALRFTLEPAVGVTDWLELGAYLQGMHSPYDGAQFGGWKLRAKFMVPERAKLPVTLGINVEVGRVPRRVEEAGWANEFRPIVGVALGRFGATFNPIFGFALTGPEAGKPDFEPALKGKVHVDHGFALGLEYYAALGRFDQGFSPWRHQEHLLFAVFDLEPEADARKAAASEWELNIGLGRALSEATPQSWVLKTIVGRSF